MLYRTYGRTGIAVSAIGFGGMRFEKSDPDSCAALIQSAYDAGINYFDTAPIYCEGKSEEYFGMAFQEMKKTRQQKPFYVSTKTLASNESNIRKDLESSLQKLRLDAVDFYHVWCIIRPEEYRERVNKGVLKTFQKLKEEGLIRHICVSSHMNGRDMAEMLRDGCFEGVLFGYSVMNFAYREAALAAASQFNCGVAIMNPLGGGVIPQNPERFAFVKSRQDETVVEGAIRFLLNDSRITTILVGLGNQSHLKEAISSIEGYSPISQETIQRIREGLRQSFDELCTACGYCNHCPQSIPIPQLMDSYNQFLLTHQKQNMLDRLKWHWGILKKGNYLDQCIECGQCEEECTQKLPIIERLKQIRCEIQKKSDGKIL